MGKIINKEGKVMEIIISDSELNELREKLKELSDSKAHIHIDIGDNHLLIHHEEDELL